jgi:hypothetical protein
MSRFHPQAKVPDRKRGLAQNRANAQAIKQAQMA